MQIANSRTIAGTRTTALAIGFAAALLAGCANTNQDTTKRTATGAATGAVIGGVIGSFSGNWGKGAAAGAAIGGAGGYLYDQIKKDNE